MTTSPFPDFYPTPPERSAYYDQQRQAWQVFSYVQVQRVLSDFTTFSSRLRGRLDPRGGVESTGLNDLDPPQHRQLRSLVTQAFTPRMVATFESRIRQLVNDLLDAVIDRGEMDVLSDSADHLPLAVIAEMLGVPEVDRRQLQEWSTASLALHTAAAIQAHTAIRDYFTALVEQRRKLGGTDLISPLLEAQIDGQHLTTAEIVSHCSELLIAGNETTKNWIGNALACFDQYPDAMAEVQAEPGLLPSALEEVVRYLPPVRLFPRVATVDTIIDGQEVKASQWVNAHIQSANRDETQFSDPDTFDIRRSPNHHLSFGYGIHFCLGAPLARLEAKTALQIMFERLDQIERVPDVPLEAAANPIVYGMKRLPIRFKRK